MIPFDWDDPDLPSSNSVSPNFSPADSQSEFPPTPEHRPNLYPSDFGIVNPKPCLIPPDLLYPAPGMASPSISPQGHYIHQLPAFNDPAVSVHPKYPSNPTLSAQPPNPPYQASAVNRHSSVTPTHYRYSRNKVTSIFLQADGMTPLTVKVDALAHPSQQVQPPLMLKIRLCVPTVDEIRAPQTLHGFHASLSLENVWSATSRCVTKVFANNALLTEEAGFLNVTHINVGTVNAALPESPLNRCRWLDASVSIVLTQEIIVDDETLIFVVYELDRKNGGFMPSATLLGYQKYRAPDKGTQISSSVSPSPGSTFVFPHAGFYPRPTTQPSLSYALNPTRYPTHKF